ncbi:MAG: response regulator [Desulfamplus sp.]|nr:response regulator [Desulfamplus sp.]
MMTTDPKPELALDWIKRGAYAYIRKPFEPEYLIDLCTKARRERSLLLVEDLLELRTQELKASEKKYRALFDNVPVGLYQVTIEGKIIAANKVCLEIAKCNSPLEQERWFNQDTRKSYVNPEDGVKFRELLKKYGYVKNFETALRRFDSSIVWLSNTAQLVEDETGEFRLINGSFIDITARKEAEAEKERLQTQLTQSQKLESIGRLAGGVAHDLNNMLSVILGNTDIAMDKIDAFAPLFDELKEIKDAAQRSANLTRQLLAFARKQNIIPKVLDLNQTVEEMLKMLRRIIGENIDLRWQPQNGLWSTKMDPSQIDQILANLCVNARDAINGVGNLTIKTQNVVLNQNGCTGNSCCRDPKESCYPICYIDNPIDNPINNPIDISIDNPEIFNTHYVLLSVSDDGCGMDSNTLKNIFEPFFTTKELGKGTGLGLATVYGIVKQNRGFIDVQSELGKGTTFNIYLPRYIEDEKDDETFRLSLVELENKPSNQILTALLVEDEQAILKLTKLMIEKEGYNVLAANSPLEAIEAATKYNGRIDLLISDIVMPQMNGYELAKNIISKYPDVKLLFMSGYTADIISGQERVSNKEINFIQKPFSTKELSAKLKDVLLV